MSNHFITLGQAITMTTLYRSEREAILIPEMRGKDILFISETFDRDAFDALLAETGAVGLRFYLGMEVDEQVRIIAVAIDENGRDILPDKTTLIEPSGGGKIVEIGIKCPPTCPTVTSALSGT
ncbi:MAG: hypothetical protein JWM28_310 [Chitinophagaceae bacterium]|nr:hypothetical protein [Chitinophagaceae bacterium]